MRLRFGARLFIAFFLLAGVGLVVLLNTAQEQIRPAIRQAGEETLVDTANLLAELAALQFEQGFAPRSAFVLALERYKQRRYDAQIWSLRKTEPDFIVYITDTDGNVLYHTDAAEIGANYRDWQDVHRTLRGEYGARTTRADPDDEWSSTMYVAAPILLRGDRVGVLTVGQPNASVQPFLVVASKQLWREALLILFAALLLGAVLAFGLSRSIHSLVNYVDALRRGEKAAPPALGAPELARLADATRAMHAEIEGKAYVDNYIHTLAHEMKSPLSAIRGAAEILQEMPHAAEAERFIGNISQESERIRQLIERLLSLATVEKQQRLDRIESIDLCALLRESIDSKLVALEKKGVAVQLRGCDGAPSDCRVPGERFLLAQAISNLLDNALDFSPPGETLDVEVIAAPKALQLVISNAGGPIPDYALDQVFDRFYSLPRPDSGRKSTGLGLSFVREVAALHGGEITLANDGEQVVARLALARQ